MIVHCPKNDKTLVNPCHVLKLSNHNKKPFSNPNVPILSNPTNYNYPTPLEYKTNLTKSIWIEKLTLMTNNMQIPSLPLLHTSRFHIN